MISARLSRGRHIVIETTTQKYYKKLGAQLQVGGGLATGAKNNKG